MRINFYFEEPSRWPVIWRMKSWLYKEWSTLHFEALLQLNDLLVMLILELLHEVIKFLHQPTINNRLLLLLSLPQFLLLLKALGNLLSQRWQLDVLLAVELSKQISDLIVAKKTPFLILLLLNLSDLPLDLMCADIVFLLGELLLHLSKIDDLTCLPLSCWDWLFNYFLELTALSLMLL